MIMFYDKLLNFNTLQNILKLTRKQEEEEITSEKVWEIETEVPLVGQRN